MDLSDLIARNASFTPDKPALRFEGETLSYAAFAARIETAARALKAEYGIGTRRPRRHPQPQPAGLSGAALCLRTARRDAGAAELAARGRRATLHPVRRLRAQGVGARAGVCRCSAARARPICRSRASIGLDFAPRRRTCFRGNCWRAPTAMAAIAHADLSSPLLIVYTSGTTGRPKGAVLRQEALLWNGVMSQHMHGLTSDDHVLTVLPFFHVGGLNIQTTPALHHGATVTIHSRFAPDTTLTAFAQDRPTLTVLVPATIQAVTRSSRMGHDRSVVAESGLHRLADRAAASDRAHHRARRAGAAGLWLDRNLPGRDLYAPRRRSLAQRLDRPARPVLRGESYR